MAYNKGSGDTSIREGNWVEESALYAVTGSTRYKLPTQKGKGGQKPLSDTAIRVIAHSDAQASAEWQSTNKSTLADPSRSKTYKRADFTGRRENLRRERYYQEVLDELARDEAIESKRKERGRFETTTQASLTNPGHNFGNIGKRVMRNQDGSAPIRPNEAYYESGLHARPPTLSSKERLAAQLRGDSFYLNDTPVTIYTQRLLEGTFPGSRVTNPKNLFAKNTGFTNDIMDPTKAHFNAVDGPSGKPVGATSRNLVEAAGGTLAVYDILTRVLRAVSRGAGGNSIKALKRIFRRLDESGDKQLTRRELRAGLQAYRIDLTLPELDVLFAHFDRDSSGSIRFEEFVRGCRAKPSERRMKLIRQAFKSLDNTGDGVVTTADLRAAFDCSKHPGVKAGELTAEQVLQEFLQQWDRLQDDDVVTLQEFVDYYTDIGASMPNEEEFELMIRNAWHMSGGKGAAANTTCRRVLVTYRDGRQSVEEIKNDLGMRSTDFDKMRVQLHRQGVHNVVEIELSDGSKKTFHPISAK